MQIIPVIDLKDGQVVHAIQGDRKHYQPIHLSSNLTANSDVDAVLADFLKLHPFDSFYIADLNAITGDGNHDQLIKRLIAAYPAVRFWIDNGSQVGDSPPKHFGNSRIVIGTESQRRLPSSLDSDFILSLDFKHQQPAGDPAWFTDSTLWPEDVIVMTLSRVGSGSGPDFQKLAELRRAYPNKNFVAAGGIRNSQDLIRLAEMGIGAALVATALHTGTLSTDEITDLQAKKYPGKPGYF